MTAVSEPGLGALAGVERAKGARRRRKSDAFPYLLLAPAALMMVVVNLVPIVQGFRMSLLKLNQYTLSQFMDAPFIGLRNYRGVLFDPTNPVHAGMLGALRNTALYSLLVTICAVAIGLGVALLLNRDFPGNEFLVRAGRQQQVFLGELAKNPGSFGPGPGRERILGDPGRGVQQ